jgi:hypothetical protein
MNKANGLATEGSRISHGNKNKQKHLPRINTELHGNKQKQNKPRKEEQAEAFATD